MKLITRLAAALAAALGAAAQDGAWTLERCIDYAKQQNITIKQRRVSVEQAELDTRDARASRLPSVSFSTSQRYSNRPFASTTATIDGSQVDTEHKNNYSASYNHNARATL